MIVYLRGGEAVEDGGHTVFPLAVPSNASEVLDSLAFAGAEATPPCDFPALHQRRGLMVQPRR